ncbi:MAG TPA: hypothetical protein VK743_05845 [Steroidobacteraceae bacterium]|nr:hypothetical protein [Steroidobacteraceae bacterium]
MRALDLFSRELLFDVKIKTNKSEGKRDWFGFLVCVLSGKSIHHVLMNE